MSGHPFQVEILTIGNELLLGFTVDSNSAFLSRRLAELGIEVTRHCTVADDVAAITDAIAAALQRSGAVITSGGLGPTSDDLTRDAISGASGCELIEDATVLRHLEKLFRDRGHTGSLPEPNRRQALVPQGADVMHNRHGTAPGLFVRLGGARFIAALPGVPSELRGLFEDELRGRLVRLAGEGVPIVSRTLRTTGIAESALALRIEESGRVIDGLAYLPGVEGVDLRVTTRGRARDVAERELAEAIGFLRKIAGEHAYGEGDADLAAVVLDLARKRGLEIGVAESCTGGLLGARLTAIPGASDVFAGGVIAYENRIKSHLLGVPETVLREHGAVSEATVLAMAAGVRERYATDIGLAISGVAGPGGGSDEKPVGTVWVASDVGGKTHAVRRIFPGNREEIRWRAAQMVLDVLRRQIG